MEAIERMSGDLDFLREWTSKADQKLGELSADQKNTLRYVENVNGALKDVRQDLALHRTETDAHGGKARGDAWATVGKILAAMAAVAPLVAWAVKSLAHGGSHGG